MLKRFFASVFLALMYVLGTVAVTAPLQGCATLGVPTADTVNKKAAEAYLAVTAGANSVITMRAAGKMSEADRDKTVAALQGVKTGIDSVVKLSTTDPGTAMTNLDRIMLTLNGLTAALAAQQAGAK